MKDYMKPEIDFVSLIAEETITDDDPEGVVGGEMGVESSIF